MINIYVILKQSNFREGFKQLLEITIPSLIVETYSVVPSYIPKEVDLIIIEPQFLDKEIRNIEEIGYLAKSGYPVCTISEKMNDKQLLEILSLKVRGVLFRTMSTQDLIKGIEQIIHGGYYIPPKAASLLLEAYQK